MSRNKLPKLQPVQWNINKLLVDKIHQVRSSYCTRNNSLKRQLIKQNRLDSMFLIRKRQLEEISRENQLIHQRIWSQKSSYAFGSKGGNSKNKSGANSRSKIIKDLGKSRQKGEGIYHIRQIQEIKRQVQKKSELSTAWQTLAKKEHTLPEKEGVRDLIEKRLVSETSDQYSRLENEQERERQRQNRTRSCKQIPNAGKLNDIVLI